MASCADALEFEPPVGTPSPLSTATAVVAMPPTPTSSASEATVAAIGEGLRPEAGALYEHPGEIRWFDAATGATHPLIQGLPAHTGEPWALAADGRLLALAHNSATQQATLLLLSAARPELREAARYEGRIEGLCWNHDAQRLALLVNRRDGRTGELLAQSVRLYDPSVGSETVLYERELRPGDPSPLALWLEGWVPGSAALYVTFALEWTDDPGTLYALDARGSEPQPVTAHYLLKGGQAICPLTSEVLLRRHPAVQAGGLRASPVYVGRADRDGRLEGWRLLCPEDWLVGAVAWAPDGQAVVVERLEPQAHGTYIAHLWLLGLDGSAPQQLTHDAAYREERPVWLPGGRGIVFERWRADRPESAGLWSLDLGGEPVLVDGAGRRPQTAAQWSP